MFSLYSMFGRSPFSPLKAHMEIVHTCVSKLIPLSEALLEQNFEKIVKIEDEIHEIEHQADLAKHDLRNNLPKSLFLPIDRSWLLDVIEMQDKLADKVEDIAVILTLRPLPMIEALKEPFSRFLKKNLEAFYQLLKIYEELEELLETSFGGIEAENVRTLVDAVALKEHQADIIQREVMKILFNSEKELTFSTFDLWQKVFEGIASISNISENLANRVRMVLELR